MSFLVRQIALKASGDEIVRAKRVDGDEMKIGRDGACGLHLPDLGVDPEHALVTQLDETHIEIESLGGQPFEVDGQSVQRKELDVTLGSELKFGSHRIKLGKTRAAVSRPLPYAARRRSRTPTPIPIPTRLTPSKGWSRASG